MDYMQQSICSIFSQCMELNTLETSALSQDFWNALLNLGDQDISYGLNNLKRVDIPLNKETKLIKILCKHINT